MDQLFNGINKSNADYNLENIAKMLEISLNNHKIQDIINKEFPNYLLNAFKKKNIQELIEEELPSYFIKAIKHKLFDEFMQEQIIRVSKKASEESNARIFEKAQLIIKTIVFPLGVALIGLIIYVFQSNQATTKKLEESVNSLNTTVAVLQNSINRIEINNSSSQRKTY